MWKPRLNFITLHYAWIITCTLSAFPVLLPYGNISATDVFFFGASSSTESGLNTIDVKDMKTYQQVFIYIVPMITNLMFINIAVVVVRLYWFRQRLDKFTRRHDTFSRDEEHAVDDDDEDAPGIIHPSAIAPEQQPRLSHQYQRHSLQYQRHSHQFQRKQPQTHLQEDPAPEDDDIPAPATAAVGPTATVVSDASTEASVATVTAAPATAPEQEQQQQPPPPLKPVRNTFITFDENVVGGHRGRGDGSALRIPGPRERDAGEPFVEVPAGTDSMGLPMHRSLTSMSQMSGRSRLSRLSRRRPYRHSMNLTQPAIAATLTIERAATSLFALGHTPPARKRSGSGMQQQPPVVKVMAAPPPRLSRHATVGRNSKFHNLTSADREILGGIEYRALKLLLVIVCCYFFGLHLLGVICLLPWIHNAPQKYVDFLEACGQGRTWWAFYSAQTMVDNLGFTLTPDSMATFKDATWPMLCMTFMAFAGNTFYPVFLRVVILIAHKLTPDTSAIKEDLRFLLDHPRRCYTLLFPSKPTWILFGILFLLNFIDVLLILILDLHNPAVNDLPVGPRILSALFQAASARHTGTSTLALADVNPAVQLSLVVMMYIAVFPIAISVRASNTYEERSLGVYEEDVETLNESDPRSYVMSHIRNQLSFDLWYIFLGAFIICIAESDRIMDQSEPAFSVFPVIFECVSAYGNVGLSLGYPSVMTSFCGQWRTISKVVLCLMMIRGRHRTLPYALDRAIMLPQDINSPFCDSADDQYTTSSGASTSGSSSDGGAGGEKIVSSVPTSENDHEETFTMASGHHPFRRIVDGSSEKHLKGQ